jgi:tRNA(fMet)-specific endonuclease VapC
LTSVKPLYLLDTDTCIYVINRRPQNVRERFEERLPGEVAISVVTYHELFYGALGSQRVEQNLQALQTLTKSLPVMSWNALAAEHTARIRWALKKIGQPIGSWDMQIAGHALALQTTLISNNLREFGRVDGLQVESWVTEDS